MYTLRRVILFFVLLPLSSSLAKSEQAYFAGGCFWCMEPPFEKVPGIHKVVSGYAGGTEKNPKYKDVASGKTSHVEAVAIHYDSTRVSYANLLQIFWRQIDPTDDQGQFVDRGFQYSPAIFYSNDNEQNLAKASASELKKRFASIKTRIVKFTSFYPAEDYHQDYYIKNPLRYKYYRYNSGRDQFLEKHWGKDRNYTPKQLPQKTSETDMKKEEQKKDPTSRLYTKPSNEEIKKALTPIQFKVTQKDSTEPPFNNPYWDNYEDGIYVDIVSGEPLFSSKDKYKSGTGWPSFVRPLEPENIVTREDRKLFMKRTEVRSKHGDSHLGHVFPDGPQPTGLRYCMNSAALRFIPASKLEDEGYGQYQKLFQK